MIEQSEQYAKIGYRLIRSNKEFSDILDFGVQIAFLASDEEKVSNRKTVFGECVKVNKNYSWCCPFDFMIIIYEPNVLEFSDKQLRVLIRHELKHIGVDLKGEKPSFYIIPHDVEDFEDIVKRYGIHWER